MVVHALWIITALSVMDVLFSQHAVFVFSEFGLGVVISRSAVQCRGKGRWKLLPAVVQTLRQPAVLGSTGIDSAFRLGSSKTRPPRKCLVGFCF